MTDTKRLQPYDPAWAASYQAERARLEEALGDITEGGVLESVAHVGGTSVPGLSARPCIDMVALTHPHPLPEDRVRAVIELGYEHLGERDLPGSSSFGRGPDAYHLQVVSFDSGHWARHVVLRDYLRADGDARARYLARTLELCGRPVPPRSPEDREAFLRGEASFAGRLQEEAFAWHVATTGFTPVRDAAREFAGLSCPWFVSSGWALDLFAGEPSRYHEDLDIVISRADQHLVQHHLLARGWRLHEVVDGNYLVWEPGRRIADGSHQVHARRGEGEFFDLLFEPREGDRWVYRRRHDVHAPMAEVALRFEGVPYLAPEVVLLFKARPREEPRAKDRADFDRIVARLGAKRRAWLAGALRTLDPEHLWLDRLERS